MKLGSLRVRVTCWYVGLLTAALLVFGASLYFGVQRYLDNSLERSLRGEANGIEQSFLSQLEVKGNVWLAGELVESYAPESSGRFIRISRQDSSKEVLYQSGDTRDSAIDSSRVSSPGKPILSPSFRRQALDGVHSLVLYSLPYTSSSGKHYLIEMGASHVPIERLLRSLLTTLAVLTPLILLIAAIGGYLLMKQPLKPVVALTLQAERIGTGELGERLPVIPSGDELERLSLSLNRMISRLEDALSHNSRFSADVSHELRTPLTILRGELEHVIQAPGLGAGVADSIGSALEEIDRMAKIVENLLAISRLDSGGAGIEHKCFDLNAVATSTADEMRLLSDEKKITVSCISKGPVPALGDEAKIKQVMVNLLDNAIKYTGDGGHVTISTRDIGQGAVLEISDNGIGIQEDSLPHVFERFYRAEKARSRGSAGAGLGLSIVQAICRAHGGSVSITSNGRTGTSVVVHLPVLSSVDEGWRTLPSPHENASRLVRQ